MRFRLLGWSALVILPLVIAAGMYVRRGATAENMKEVNRCLSIVRVATSRRGNRGQAQLQWRCGSATRTDTPTAFVTPTGNVAQSA